MEKGWISLGSRAKQFKSQHFDLTMTWYPGKLNSLLVYRKDGDKFKEFLVSVLGSNCAEQPKVYTDSSSSTIAGALLDTVSPLAESVEAVGVKRVLNVTIFSPVKIIRQI